jgi:signal transduction histidine kinase/ligand-binding sensor domain-containing protein
MVVLGCDSLISAAQLFTLGGVTRLVIKRICWLASLLLAGATATSIASAAPSRNPWYARVWLSDDGLPNNDVTSLAQTTDGYLWVATPSRLTRFDGVHFDEFRHSQFVTGNNIRMTVIVAGRDGSLWVPIDRGPVVRLHAGVAEVVTNDLPNLVVEDAVEDGDGALWISYRGGPIRKVKDGRVFQFTASQGLPATFAGCFFTRDRDGRLWLVKNGQVLVWQKDHFDAMAQVSDTSTRLAAARDGGIWICSGLELFHCDQSRRLTTVGRLSPESPGTYPTVLMEDRDGMVWVGTSSGGLFRYDGKGFELVPTSHRGIFSLLQDREGNLWVGTAGGGLDRIQVRGIDLQGDESGLPYEAVQSICEDRDGTLWATTQNGLLVTGSNDVWTTISAKTNWTGGLVSCVTADPRGGVWIAARAGRLHHMRDGVLETVGGLADRVVHTLCCTEQGDLWIGGNGLECYHDGEIKVINAPPSARMIRAMTADHAGNVWFGTVGGSLFRGTRDAVIDETANTMGAPDSIRCLTVTDDGSLWIGFAGTGIGRLKNRKFSRVRTLQGLGDESISQIQPDGAGSLWIGADHGIFKVRQQELDAVADGRSAHVRSVHYGRDIGLPSLQANFGASPGTLRSRDGRVWMPMRSALAAVDPARLRDDLSPPRVLLKRIVVDDQTVAAYGGAIPVSPVLDLQAHPFGVRFPPGHHRVEFEFTALNFSTPENMQFRYRLAGVDDGWNDAGSERIARYSRLTAGHYRFEVTASKNGGVWNEAGADFDFVVTPFFWDTWWFRLLIVGAFTAGTIGVGRYISFRRLRVQVQALEQQAALEKERARIAKDIHDDLGGSLTQAALLLDLTLQDRREPEKVEGHVRQVANTVRQVTESLDEIVWAANPRNDTLHDLIDYISVYAVQFLQTANVRCRVETPENLPNRPLSPEVRHGLFLVVKETLNNVVRHARASEVRLEIVATGESLSLVIADDGRGFASEPRDGYADGLRNMRQRMADIGGAFNIESKPGGGTRISANYDWPPANA